MTRQQEPSALGRAAEEYAEKEAWSKNVRSFSHNLQFAFYAGAEWMKNYLSKGGEQ